MKTAEEIADEMHLDEFYGDPSLSPHERKVKWLNIYANQFKTSWNTTDILPDKTGNILLFIPESDEGKEEIRMYYFVLGMKKIADGCFWTNLPEPPCK